MLRLMAGFRLRMGSRRNNKPRAIAMRADGEVRQRPFLQSDRNFAMQPVVLDERCGRANADGAASQMKRTSYPAKGLLRPFRPRDFVARKSRRLDESSSDELLDDWMASCPAAESVSSD